SCFWLLGVLPDTLNSSDNVGIRAAAANISAHEFLHLGILRTARFFQQRNRRHDLPGCAIAALIGVGGNKGRLDRVQISRLPDALNCRDLFALVHCGEGETGIHASTIDVDCASTALAMITSF